MRGVNRKKKNKRKGEAKGKKRHEKAKVGGDYVSGPSIRRSQGGGGK